MRDLKRRRLKPAATTAANEKSQGFEPWLCRFIVTLVFLILSNAVDQLLGLFPHLVAKAVFHQIRVFARVIVKGAKHADRPELLLAEEKLRRQVRLAHFQRDAR